MLRDKLWQYLKDTTVSKMIGQGFVALILIMAAGFAWTIATNFQYIVDRWDNFAPHEITRDQLIQDIENSVRINIALEDLLEEVQHSARSYVFKFHNGTVGADGLSFIYQSATHMVARPGFVNNIQDLQRIPLSINPIKALAYVEGNCFNYHTNPGVTNNAFNSQLLNQGIGNLFTCPIYNNQGLLIGFIGVDFLYAAGSPEISDSEINDVLTDYAERVKEYVSSERIE